jgi:hypothetical protein
MLTMTTPMTNLPELFYRDGKPYTGSNATTTPKGYSVTEPVTCGRCMGSGHYSYCQMWGTTCFDCKGRKMVIDTVPLYTADKLAKLNVAEQKRNAKKASAQEAKQAEAARIVAENTAKFDAEHADLLVALGSLIESKPIIADIVRKGREKGSITDPQKSVLVNAVASAQQHAAVQAASTHFGAIGDKVNVKVTVTHNANFVRPSFRGYGEETVYITSMTDANGNVFITKTPNFNEPKGDTFTLTGIVKEHSDYRGVKQTVLKNAKRTEIPTGQAAGFKKIGGVVSR